MDRAAFSCGERSLDEFFRVHAGDFHDQYKARVTVGLYEGRIVSFYWLAVQSASPAAFTRGDDLRDEFPEEYIDDAPCIYLGMIATHAAFAGRGIGRTMMVHAMRQTLAVAEIVGVYALTLDAIDADLARRYAAWGFEYFEPGQLWMYIPLQTIRAAVREIDLPSPPASASA